MNYRHLYHAGSFCDVFKHFILTELLLKLREKETPFCIIDTHGGLGLYDVASKEAQKTMEYQRGVEEFLQKAGGDPDFDPYCRVIQAVNGEEGQPLKNYPGSPFFSRFYLRKQDRLRVCEWHPEDVKALQRLFEKDRRVKIFFQDGYGALKALLPPLERRGMVLIDPPFEKKDEFERIVQGLKEGLRRFAHGIYCIWYPLKEGKPVQKFYEGLVRLKVKEVLRLEMTLLTPLREEGLQGCGMAIVNPPWLLEEKMKALLPKLSKHLNARSKVMSSGTSS